jgi:hypothetical protein
MLIIYPKYYEEIQGSRVQGFQGSSEMLKDCTISELANLIKK